MEKKVFEITMLGKDIFINSDDINYATLGNGTHEGIQTNTTNSMYINDMKQICADIHYNVLKLMKRLKQIKNDTED